MPAEETIWQIAVRAIRDADDARGRTMLAAIRRAGFDDVHAVRSTRLYQLQGSLTRDDAEALASGLFADPVTEEWSCQDRSDWPASPDALVEVHLQPGVMDPVAMSSATAARDLLEAMPSNSAAPDVRVRTAWGYEVASPRSLARIVALARQVLANACIETVYICGAGRRDQLPQRHPEPPARAFERRTVRLRDRSDKDLDRLSREAHLFLSTEEMRAVRDHFAEHERDPSDLELETIAQTWSEHCVHKTLKSAVEYEGRPFGRHDESEGDVKASYGNLLADTVVRATRRLARPWCLSVFEDNAGVIEFDDRYGIAFKVETHNHPSAIEPYGGAATGVGGCIRDILGCGLGAKPIANTDVFCLAEPDFPAERLPAGVLRPGRVLRGVVSGVRDYGNRMGIPTLAGALYFDNRYLANPLVFCGCVGLIPRNRLRKGPAVGDKIVLVGGRTGRDGIGGATFSSAELTEGHADEFAHAVQIGNAIEEKKVLDALLRARDHTGGCLYSSITDCGAGGLSSAVGEMAAKLGARVQLEKVPLKYSGLRYNEIWLSEAQERMVLSVPAGNLAAFLTLFGDEEVETAVIGDFTGDGQLVLTYHDVDVGRLSLSFLHEGLPKRRRPARWDGPQSQPTISVKEAGPKTGDLGDELLCRLRSPNACSRESIFRQYDLEVQGTSVIKPLVGVGEGPSDAVVIRPLPDSDRGVAIGCGLSCLGCVDDPYWMAFRAIDEAVRNMVCVGADPDRIAILDNFCWGGCQGPGEMGALVRACQACHDTALAYGTPFISGKDSLNNQFSLSAEDAERLGLPAMIAIPATLLISAVGIVADVRRCVTSDLKQAGNRLVYVSAEPQSRGLAGCAAMHRAVAHLVQGGEVAACHDVSDGGLAVCIAEMCIGGRRGARVCLDGLCSNADAAGVLFDEGRAGYVIEAAGPTNWSELDRSADVVDLGTVQSDQRLSVEHHERRALDLEVGGLASAWRASLGLEEGV